MSAVSTNVDCIGDDDGTIDLTISPVGTYTIDWDNDGTGDFDDNEDLILLAAGSYNVVVQDVATGCRSSLKRRYQCWKYFRYQSKHNSLKL